MSTLDKKLLETEAIRSRNWGKLISVLKLQFNNWAMERLAEKGYEDFQMAYMPVIMNITLAGINNNDLAAHARVTKQAMSKVALQLQRLGYIKTKKDPRDKRSIIIMLTDRGKKLVIEARSSVCAVEDQYRAFLKPSEYDRTIEVLRKIIEYNENTLLARK